MAGFDREALYAELRRRDEGPKRGLLGALVSSVEETVDKSLPDIITYIESSWGLGVTLYPIQKFVLKLIFGLALDDEQRTIQIWDRFRENVLGEFTEAEFLDYLHAEGRCNISREEHEANLGRVKTQIIFRLGRRGTKCLNENTYCHTSKGLLTLKELASEHASLGDVPDGRGTMHPIGEVIDNGEQDTLRITTNLGTEIEGLPEHRVWVLDERGDEGWKFLDQLRTGDVICHSRRNGDCWGEEKPYSIEQFELWGLYVGDGCVTESNKRVIAFAVEAKEESFLVERLLGRVTGKATYWFKRSKNGGTVCIFSTSLRREWARLGFGYDVKSTGIPEIVRTASRPQQAAFLRGLFEADGCAFGSRKIFLSCKSKELATQVQLMLLGFGIVSSKREERIQLKSWDSPRTYCRVEIKENRDREVFVREIGFLWEDKKRKSDAASRRTRQERDSVPNQEMKLKAWWESLKPHGAGKASVRALFTSFRNNWNITRRKIAKILATFPQDVPLRRHFAQIQENDFAYAHVVKIEETRCYTRDLSVPESRVYVAGGMVTHNSSVSRWIAQYLMFRLARMQNPQAHYQLTPDQVIGMVMVAASDAQVKDLFSPLVESVRHDPYLSRYNVDPDATTFVELRVGPSSHKAERRSRIRAKSGPCSARSLLGGANILILLEEYGRFFFELVGSNRSDKAIYDALVPTKSDFIDPETGNPDGMLLVISTPWSKDSHMHKLEQQIFESVIADGLIINIPSYWVNPRLHPNELRSYYNADPLLFDVQYGAEWVEGIATAFTRPKIEALWHDPDEGYGVLRPGEVAFAGVDLGLTRDGTVIAIVAASGPGLCRLILHECHRHDQLDWIGRGIPVEELLGKLAQRVDHWWRYFSVHGGYADFWNLSGLKGQLVSDARKKLEQISVTPQENDRVARHFIETVNLRQLVIYEAGTKWDNRPAVEWTFSWELTHLQRVQTSGDPPKVKLCAPASSEHHDDSYSAVSRALWAAKEGIEQGVVRQQVAPTNPMIERRRAAAREHLDSLRAQRQDAMAARGLIPRRR